ncbi:MAG: ATP-binding cassette domain-containing protein, partial [Thermoplasmatota archaeon]
AYPDMTAAAFLGFIARMRGFHGAEARRRVGRVAELLAMRQVLGERVEWLSKGARRRVGVAQALLHDPAVLILDEPTRSVDPAGAVALIELIRGEVAAGRTAVLVTHDLGEAGFLGDTLVLMQAGRIVQQDTFDNLLRAPADEFVTRFINAQRQPRGLQEGKR